LKYNQEEKWQAGVEFRKGWWLWCCWNVV